VIDERQIASCDMKDSLILGSRLVLGGYLAMSQKGGYELPATNLALAALIAAVGPGRYALGPGLPKALTRGALAGAAALTALSVSKVLKKRRATAPAGEPAAEAAGEGTTEPVDS
jgi:hypothetical protein